MNFQTPVKQDEHSVAEQLTAERVINVHTTKPYDWVLDNVFDEAQVGRRLKTLFWKSDKPGSSHFFIEFADRHSVQLAQHAVVPGVTVHALSRNMNMYPVYDCLVHGKELPLKKRPGPPSDAGISPSSDKVDAARLAPAFTPTQPTSKRQRYESGASAGRGLTPPPYRSNQEKTSPLSTKAFPPSKGYPSSGQDRRDINQPRYSAYDRPPPKSQTWTNPSYSDRRPAPPPSFNHHQRGPSNGNAQYKDDKYQRVRYRDDERHIPSSNSSRSTSPPRRTESSSAFFPQDSDRDRAPYRDLESTSNRLRSTSDASLKKKPSSLSMSADLPMKPAGYSTPSLTRVDIPLPPAPLAYNPTSPTIPGLTHTRQEHPLPPPPSTPMVAPPPFNLKTDASSMGVTPEDNISVAIESLKAGLGGPETWMTAAAQYRRRGMHKHALAIVDTMLEVMRERGMDRSTLRPALLLMAQCHYTIAQEQAGQPETKESADRHFVTLLDWLRETYGPNTPIMDAVLQSGSDANLNDLNTTTTPASTIKSNAPAIVNGSGTRIGTVSSNLPSAAASRAEAMAAENAQLRQRQTTLLAELAALRLQRDDLSSELRSKDSKLARAIEDGRVEAARGVREGDARRRAEEKLAGERRAWEARTAELREEGARNAVRDLSAILGLASRSPLMALEATRSFCESKAAAATAARLERGPSGGGGGA